MCTDDDWCTVYTVFLVFYSIVIFLEKNPSNPKWGDSETQNPMPVKIPVAIIVMRLSQDDQKIFNSGGVWKHWVLDWSGNNPGVNLCGRAPVERWMDAVVKSTEHSFILHHHQQSLSLGLNSNSGGRRRYFYWSGFWNIYVVVVMV